MPNPSGIVPSGNWNVLIVETFAHFAPNAVDISKSISESGSISVILKSRIGNCGSDGLIFSYQSLTSSRVASLISKLSF